MKAMMDTISLFKDVLKHNAMHYNSLLFIFSIKLCQIQAAKQYSESLKLNLRKLYTVIICVVYSLLVPLKKLQLWAISTPLSQVLTTPSPPTQELEFIHFVPLLHETQQKMQQLILLFNEFITHPLHPINDRNLLKKCV